MHVPDDPPATPQPDEASTRRIAQPPGNGEPPLTEVNSADRPAAGRERAAGEPSAGRDDQSTRTLPPDAPAKTDYPAPAPQLQDAGLAAAVAGRMVGDYELLEVIARGGMGVVYKARQKKLQRTVALKMIRSGQFASEEEVQRFSAEAEAAAQLDHPGIVPIFEVGDFQGQLYFSMGFVEGGSLADRVRDGPLHPRQAVELVKQVAEAIAFAHKQGIIHRDLKPANVLLDRDGRPKVTDFGLAKRVQMDSHLTLSGQIVGTPSYMSPEQAAGNRDDVGPAADTYSTGALLYCLLTGRPPFQSASALDTLRQVQEHEPVSPRHLNAAVSRDLETICLKCLQKDPKLRYGSALALAEDLRRFLAGEPIQARPVSRPERLWRWAKRNPFPALLIAGIALSLMLGTAVAWYFAIQANAEAGASRTAKRLSDRRRYNAEVVLAERNWRDGRIALVKQQLQELNPEPGDPDLRGFEWYYLQRLCHLDLQTLQGHDGSVFSVVFSPDGRRLASAGLDKTVKIWDCSTGQAERTLPGHEKPVFTLAFSPDSRWLASAGADKTIRIWDVATGRQRLELAGHADLVRALAFRPKTGAWLASASADKTVKIWDVRNGRPLRTLKHTEPVWAVDFSSDGQRIASGGSDGMIYLWNADTDTGRRPDAVTDRPIRSLRGHQQTVYCLTFSVDGRLLASTSADQTVKLWNVTSWQEIHTWAALPAPGTSLAFSPDSRRIAAVGDEQIVKVWEVETGREALTLRGHEDRILGVAFSPDGRRIASADSGDGVIKIWDATSSQESLVLAGHTAPVESVAFSGDGQWLATASLDKTIRIWDVTTGQSIRILRGHTDSVLSVAFSPQLLLASASEDGTVRLWDPSTGQNKGVLHGHTAAVRSVAFHPEGTQLASASWDQTIRIWDSASGTLLHILPEHGAQVDCVAFGPGGQLASAGKDNTVRLWNAQTGQLIRTLRSDAVGVVSLAFSPDGERLVAAGEGPAVQVWDVRTGQQVLTLRGHTRSPRAVAYDPQGSRIASAGRDQMVKIWDAAIGQETLTLRGDSCVAFSPDGLRLAGCGLDNTARIWDVTPLTPGRLEEREALSVARHWLTSGLPQSRVVDEIRRDPAIRETVRRQALALIEQHFQLQAPAGAD